MSKGLEALERGIIEFEKDLEDDCNNEWLKRVVAGMKKCYQRLEAIDNANPSEALEKLNIIKFNPDDVDGLQYLEAFKVVELALLKAQEQEKKNTELKRVLEIIKNKKVDIWKFIDNGIFNYSYDDYYFCWNYYSCEKLTEEEFDTLKRYFE